MRIKILSTASTHVFNGRVIIISTTVHPVYMLLSGSSRGCMLNKLPCTAGDDFISLLTGCYQWNNDDGQGGRREGDGVDCLINQ